MSSPEADVLLSVVVVPSMVDDGGAADLAAARYATEQSFAAQGPGPWELLTATTGSSPAQRLNEAAGRARGRYVAAVEVGDRLEPGVLAAVATTLERRPDPAVLYTDEQWPSEDSSGVFTKPRWVPSYLEARNYLGRLCLVRRDVLTEVGGWRDDMPGAVEWDLALRVTELDRGPVLHVPVPGVLRAAAPPEDPATLEAGRRAVAARFERLGVPARVELTGDADGDVPGFLRVWREVARPPLVSVVIPTIGTRRELRGQDVLMVAQTLRSLVRRTTYPDWEVVLVTSEGTPAEVVAECREICGDRLRVAPVNGAFNFSRSINTGVAHARGELVLLLNDDVEVLQPRWLERMVAVLSDEGVGAVGAKLLFEDGTIQHTGVFFDNAGQAGHLHIGEPEGLGHFGTKAVDLDFLAVTGACILVPRAVFVEVGGLSEDLPVNYNDVDFCLKLIASGRRVVSTPFARLYHYEGSSRQNGVSADEHAAVQWWRPRTMSDPWVNLRGLS